jgi:hypothetical protein
MMLALEPIEPVTREGLYARRKEIHARLRQAARAAAPLSATPQQLAQRMRARLVLSQDLPWALPSAPVPMIPTPHSCSLAKPPAPLLPPSARFTISQIVTTVAAFYGKSPSDILSASRKPAICRPRQIACYLAKSLTPRSLPEIGRRIGGRDHTTVLHAVNKIARQRETDAVLAAELCELRRMLRGDRPNGGSPVE